MRSVIREVPIEAIAPNPHRDFDLYPIDEQQVEKLQQSILDLNGIWHALPARARPRTEGSEIVYELAFGHHRVEAGRRVGLTTIPLQISEFDDDTMIRMLATENATQRGDNVAASLDSVAAITKRLAYLMLRAETLQNFGESFGRLFASDHAFGQARRLLLDNKGIGSPLIVKFAPAGSLERGEVEGAIATLKTTGTYNQIIREVTERVERELAEEEAERQRREDEEREREARLAEAARKRAEADAQKAKEREDRERARQAEQERKQAEAEERRRQADERKQAEAAAKAQREAEEAERRAKEHEEHVRQMAAERERIEAKRKAAAEAKAKEDAAKAEREEADRKERLKREHELEELERKAAAADPLLDVRVLPYFPNHYALKRFRDFVTGEARIWPEFQLENQLDLVKRLSAEYTAVTHKPGRYMTANFIGNTLEGMLDQMRRGKARDEAQQRSLDQRFDKQMETARKGSSIILGAVNNMLELLKKGAGVPDDFEDQLRALEFNSIEQIKRLREATGYRPGAKQVEGDAKRGTAHAALSPPSS